MQVIACSLVPAQHPDMSPGDPWFKLNGFNGSVQELFDLEDRFDRYYREYIRKESNGEDIPAESPQGT